MMITNLYIHQMREMIGFNSTLTMLPSLFIMKSLSLIAALVDCEPSI